MSILQGQYIPTDNKNKRINEVILIGEKPSDYFLKHPKEKHFGNYNNPRSRADICLQKYIKKYLGQVYITDMVKTEGLSGANFEIEWHKEPIHKKYLLEELNKIKPRKIGAFGRKVEKLLKQEFPEYNINYLIHPSATRYPKNLTKWDKQFKQLIKKYD